MASVDGVRLATALVVAEPLERGTEYLVSLLPDRFAAPREMQIIVDALEVTASVLRVVRENPALDAWVTGVMWELALQAAEEEARD